MGTKEKIDAFENVVSETSRWTGVKSGGN